MSYAKCEEKIPVSKVDNLCDDSINSVEIIPDKSLVFACCDQKIVTYNEVSKKTSTFFSSTDRNDEISNLKHFGVNEHNNQLLLTANGNLINLFDLATAKLVDRLKFCKDTINCIELASQNRSVLACGDDTGEIKLLDVRSSAKAAAVPTLTLKKSLKGHENICFTLKYNPANEFELFSGSFDCSIIKWDTRFPKSGSKNPFVSKINANEVIQQVVEMQNKDSQDDLDYLVSSMTPSFVHSLFFATGQLSKPLLLCGIENGLCLGFDPVDCRLTACKQLQSFNCALTQFESLGKSRGLSGNVVEAELIAAGGNGKRINFVQATDEPEASGHLAIKLNNVDSISVDHGKKINCMRFANGKLYVADTSNDLSIYDFSEKLLK